MLYIAIPVYNEAPTIGVLVWRIRKLFQDYSRDYEIVVYDDGSTDSTREVLAPYADVLPLTVLGDSTHRGYAASIDALCREVSSRTRYPRRDAVILMQGDFTDQPEHITELVKQFEGGIDVVVGERQVAPTAPVPEKRLRWLASFVTKPFLNVPGVPDPFGTMRLYRISVLRDLLKAVGSKPVTQADGWGANAELLMRMMSLARRTESVPLTQRFDLRARDSRIKPWADAMTLFHFGRRSKSLVPAAVPAPPRQDKPRV